MIGAIITGNAIFPACTSVSYAHFFAQSFFRIANTICYKQPLLIVKVICIWEHFPSTFSFFSLPYKIFGGKVHRAGGSTIEASENVGYRAFRKKNKNQDGGPSANGYRNPLMTRTIIGCGGDGSSYYLY